MLKMLLLRQHLNFNYKRKKCVEYILKIFFFEIRKIFFLYKKILYIYF